MVKPVIFINKGLDVLSSILRKLNPEKIFIVASKTAYASVSDDIQVLVKGINVYIFNDFSENPDFFDVSKGISIYNKYSPDMILAVGGGSAIDIAKSIKILAVQNNNIEKIIKGEEKIFYESSIPLVVMPTTAGTGSEATHFSVIYLNKKKYSLQHKSMLPNYVILDHYLVRTMPKYLAACTVFDALSQAVESHWSKYATKESKKYSGNAIRLILSNLPVSIVNPNNKNRKEIVKAAYLSGCSINITKTTAPHAISYSLTSYFGIPHGHAVASLLGQAAVVSYDICTDKQKFIFHEIFEMFNCTNSINFCLKWRDLMLMCGLETRLGKLGVSNTDVMCLVNNINIDRMKGHPVILNENQVKVIVEESL